MNDQSHRWHILIASPSQEIKAGEGLLERGIEAFVPKVARAQRAGRSAVRIVPRPMFQCYLFANLSVEDGLNSLVARATPGIQGFLMLEFNRYATLPTEAIDMIRFTEAEIEEDRCRKFNRAPAFEVGQRVIAPKGRWAELAGKLKTVKSGFKAEMVLEMALLGRDTVTVDLRHVQPAE